MHLGIGHRNSRRKLVLTLGSGVVASTLAAPWVLTSRKSLAQSLPATPACGSRTPPQMEGPFFTPLSPERASLLEADMRGPRMVLKGQVVDSACRPLAGALLDFWQCDDQGRYDNQGYRLRGHQFANRQGAFSLSTLLPGEYPGRTPHLHVKVQPANGRVLTTQLYLPDHPRNQRDFLFDPRLVVSKKDDGFYFQFVV
ncbi:MAG: intradiol ring-cleavage dioxygenase [Burkholderiaceae bacterium]